MKQRSPITESHNCGSKDKWHVPAYVPGWETGIFDFKKLHGAEKRLGPMPVLADGSHYYRLKQKAAVCFNRIISDHFPLKSCISGRCSRLHGFGIDFWPLSDHARQN